MDNEMDERWADKVHIVGMPLRTLLKHYGHYVKIERVTNSSLVRVM